MHVISAKCLPVSRPARETAVKVHGGLDKVRHVKAHGVDWSREVAHAVQTENLQSRSGSLSGTVQQLDAIQVCHLNRSKQDWIPPRFA